MATPLTALAGCLTLNRAYPSRRPGVLSRFGHWRAELILVFVGVYGAFWLNGYEEQSVEQALQRYQASAREQEQRTAEFRRQAATS